MLQEPVLFSGTIWDCLTVGRSEVSSAEVLEATMIAAIHDDIAAMPLGHQTMLSEGGCSLSGGQRQRIALARALLQRPAILVLDEATSHLDVIAEAKVHQNLQRLACTRIVIAHRLSTVSDADRILVLDKGRIVETGTHAELCAKGGLYFRLSASQGDNRERRPMSPLSSPPPQPTNVNKDT